jgi:GTPase SAR1 family protein
MAKKQKETCPYCGKAFVYLNRHKCPNSPEGEEAKGEAPIEKKEKKKAPSVKDEVERFIEPRKLIPKDSILSKIDLKSDRTIKFISKFIDLSLIKSNRAKSKKLIKDIFSNSINCYNFLSKEDTKIITECYKIKKIADFSKLDSEDIYITLSVSAYKKIMEQIEKNPELEEKLRKIISFSSILKGIKDKSIYLEKEQHKVIVTGLDKAGKTALLMKFAGNLGIDMLSKLKPTYGVERLTFETDEINLFVWDFGGQETYRKNYLARPEQYFLEIALLIYVIDVQDWERFEESFDYLARILDILKVLDEYPDVMVFLHKYDPDLREDPNLNLDVEFVKDVFKDMFQERPFRYDTYLTSIYSSISKEAQFSKFIKTMVDEGNFIANPRVDRVEALGEVLNNTLNSFIKLSESVSRQFLRINERIGFLERAIGTVRGSENFAIPAKGSDKVAGLKPPPPPPPPPEKPKIPAKAIAVQSVRNAIMGELKELFTRVKRKDL